MKQKIIPNKDAFGRFETQEEGFVYQITNGRPFLFCGTDIFADERLKAVFLLVLFLVLFLSRDIRV
jgi:hypothetical protein